VPVPVPQKLSFFLLKNALSSSYFVGELCDTKERGGRRSIRTHREAGVGECGGDIQCEHVLHVSRHQEALLRHGGEPNRAWVGRGSQRQGPGTSLDEVTRFSLCCSCRLHWRQACRNHGQSHGLPHQWHPCPSSQRSRCSLALVVCQNIKKKKKFYHTVLYCYHHHRKGMKWSFVRVPSSVPFWIHFCFHLLTDMLINRSTFLGV